MYSCHPNRADWHDKRANGEPAMDAAYWKTLRPKLRCTRRVQLVIQNIYRGTYVNV